ncbi:MAG: acyl--CoA ligase, partial [Gammaproteobacteria bacterium CG22_combo_CG10-13_8_21_14_all_40_8]
LAAVPPLWQQLAKLNWQDKDRVNLRYFTNSGGAMPTTTLAQLRQIFPNATPYLMYGLTEAFRSTYLDPTEIDKRPQSIGKAIPGAEVLVLRSDGTLCDAMEQGELVHFGVHVAQGYWRDPERTQQKFRPLSVPSHNQQSPETHTAVWSGDRVYRDDEGFIYFIARADEMIKTSGYRVSPEEIEEVLLQHPQVLEVVALGAPHPQLGDAIILVVVFDEQQQDEIELKKEIEAFCKKQLPNFMQPQHIVIQAELTKNANGKQDRARLKSRFHGFFSPQDPPIISTLDPQISD